MIDDMDRHYREGSARANRAREAKTALTALRQDFKDATAGANVVTLSHIDALLMTCEQVQERFVGAWN